MAKIMLKTFDDEQEAKDYFAEIVESEERHGAFVTKAGKVFLNDQAEPIVAVSKWVVVSSSAAVVSDDA